MTERDVSSSWRFFNLNWLPVMVMGGLLLLATCESDFSIGPLGFGVTSATAVVLALLAYLMNGRAAQRLAFMFGALGQVVLLTAIAGPLSYVACAFNWPLQDATLAALDHAMGFDTKPAILFINDNEVLAGLLNIGYAMIKWPLLAIPIVLAATSRFLRLQQFIAALSIALMMTIALSMAEPAIGVYQTLGLASGDVPHVNILAFTLAQHDILAVRDGSMRHLDLFSLAGIVTFPSFHAASAVLYAWAFAPVRVFGPIAMVLNILMIASTPVIGGHYLIDVFAGIAVAMAAIAAAHWLFARPSTAANPAFAVPAE